ncbi:hypothetical protein BofuT4_uP069860.1 [Botrytis cinerea T4]|uniref:NmrA-like domain-containing protein n=1 Tax=Botryotinia fuckeliana (strain T4) TaxID=999810 RepID=G2XQP1_BOTF4|nr:hypothetical protein BofuT4_uP069860.1 [Botrytis cinerea T4]
MATPITVGAIGATGNTGQTVVNGLLASSINLERQRPLTPYIDILISCITWEHLEHQTPWIETAKEAGVKRFMPSE